MKLRVVVVMTVTETHRFIMLKSNKGDWSKR